MSKYTCAKAKSQAEKRQEWIADGLCSQCGSRPAAKPKKCCQECLDYHRDRRNSLIKLGVCKCGRGLTAQGRCCEKCRANTRKHNRSYRQQCLEAYGNKCACCGETTNEFLQIDHINNDGAAHRKEIGLGQATYRWLIKRGFPQGFQILCANCNYALAHYGCCPHRPEIRRTVSHANKEVSHARCRRRKD